MDSGSVIADRYKLISLLGRGGMGEVWRGEHLGLRAPVAIKLIGAELSSNAEMLQRFNREAQSAAALRSPHVVQILDHGVDPATRVPFIAMELMEGETLSQRISHAGRLSLADTARIVTHIARALSRAHEAGIVHRDLKPDNVFLVRNEDEEIAKVLDFGIAKVNAHALTGDVATRTGAIMGTPYYMSPEQIGGSKKVDHRTDLWALAVIACECVTGRRPFDSETIGALVLAICTQPLPVPSALGPVPPSFDVWAARALERDPARRFQSARELAEALRAVLGEAGSVTATGPFPAAPPADGPINVAVASVAAMAHTTPQAITTAVPRRSRAPLIAIGAALAVGAVGLGAWALRGPSAAAPPSELPSRALPNAATPPTAAEPKREISVVPASEPAAPAIASAVIPTPSAAANPPIPAASPAPARTAPPAKPWKPPAAAPRPAPATPSKPKPPADSSSIFDRRKG